VLLKSLLTKDALSGGKTGLFAISLDSLGTRVIDRGKEGKQWSCRTDCKERKGSWAGQGGKDRKDGQGEYFQTCASPRGGITGKINVARSS